MYLAALIPRKVTLDEFVALNDEIAALSRAGIPLNQGLLELGRDLPGRLGKISTELGEKLQQGQSLEQAVAAGGLFSPAYRAVVEAGVRVGRLPAALESVAHSARRTAQLRKTISLALIYPLALVGLAYYLMIFTLTKLLPVMLASFTDLRTFPAMWIDAAAALRATVDWWWPAPPLLAAIYFAWAWRRTGRASQWELHPWLSFGLVGALARLRRAQQSATLCDILALLMEHDVRLPRSIVLAAEASGSASLAASARELAARLECGESSAGAGAGFPPLVAWILTMGAREPELTSLMRRCAADYEAEAVRRARWLTFYLPILITAIGGGGAVLVHAILTWGPIILLLRRISQPF